MTLFLCHNCCNINSPSGEACIIEAFEGVDHDTILHGANDCIMGYQRNVSDNEREKYTPLILPDEVSIDTDFYKLASVGAQDNYNKIVDKPLWVLNNLVFFKSNEDQLWDQAEKQIRQYKITQKAAKRAIERQIQDDAVCSIILSASPCTLDPLSSHGMVR